MPDSPPAAARCVYVNLELDAATPALAIEQLAQGFAAAPDAPAPRALANAALLREAQASTYLGHRTALPHARLAGLPHLWIAFGRLRQPIAWPPDDQPVEFVFLGAVPASQPRHYLEFMRSLGRALHDPATPADLRQLADAGAARAWLAAKLALQ